MTLRGLFYNCHVMRDSHQTIKIPDFVLILWKISVTQVKATKIISHKIPIMSIFRQSLKKLSMPSPMIRSYSQNPLKPPLGMCPEELNIRQDDEHDRSDENKKDEARKERETRVPNFSDMEKSKEFEFKSKCTNFQLNTEGF